MGFTARENKHKPTETCTQAECCDTFARGDLFLVKLYRVRAALTLATHSFFSKLLTTIDGLIKPLLMFLCHKNKSVQYLSYLPLLTHTHHQNESMNLEFAISLPRRDSPTTARG